MRMTIRDMHNRDNNEYEIAYEIVEHAITLLPSGVFDRLSLLQGAMYKASFFVNEELEELPERVAKIPGLPELIQERAEE